MKYLICLLLLIFTQISSADSSKVIRVCWESEMKPPFLMRSARGELKGIIVDLLNKIFITEAIHVKNLVYPWKRCLLDLERGNVDIVPNASFKLSRSKFAHYSKPIYTTNLSFFYLKSRFPNAAKFSNIEQFKAYVVGGISGFNYSFYKDDITIDTGVHSRRGLIHKLIKHRIDFAILQREVFFSMYINNIKYIKNIGYVKAPKKHIKNYHILVSKKSNNSIKILNIINDGFSRLQKSGEYKIIYNQYVTNNSINCC